MLMKEIKDDLKAALEAILFASGEWINREKLVSLLEISLYELDEIIQELIKDYQSSARGIQIYTDGDSIRLGTKPQYAEILYHLLKIPNRRLSTAALETLAVIAYQQPITRAELERIRGVKSEKTLSVLLDKGLIQEAGHKDTLGKPVLYTTTQLFLEAFNLKSLEELPALN